MHDSWVVREDLTLDSFQEFISKSLRALKSTPPIKECFLFQSFNSLGYGLAHFFIQSRRDYIIKTKLFFCY